LKKNTFTLDDDFEEESPLLDDTAILFFQSDIPNYIFADDLNHLYRLNLTRTDDVPVRDASWPFYSYHDHLRLLKYFLVERPDTSTKILIIRGEDAPSESARILHEFSDSPAESDPLNPDLQHRNGILLSYQQSLTPVTAYDPNPPLGLSRKAAKERQELDTLLTTLLDHLDLNHL